MSHRVHPSSEVRNQALKRLFKLQELSIANYASQAQLHVNDGEREYLDVILEIAKHQTEHAALIGGLLSARRAYLTNEAFPMRLTGLNYLSAKHVVRQMLIEQPQLIAAVRECLDTLHDDEEGQMLARRTLTSEEGNRRRLKHVLRETTSPADNLRMAA